MNNNVTKYRLGVLTLAIAGVLGIAPLTASSDNQHPGVYPPDSLVLSRTYGEWSASWWQYMLAIPAPQNPTTDTSGQFCQTKPSGAVSFLAGKGDGQAVTRTCTVSSAKPIFFPIINVECSTLEAAPFNCTDEQSCRACAGDFADAIGKQTLKATIDGQDVRALSTFRVQSPKFDFQVPGNNILGVAAGKGFSVSDGYWLMLKPLPAGTHTIHFEGAFPAFQFSQNVTYYLTVTD